MELPATRPSRRLLLLAPLGVAAVAPADLAVVEFNDLDAAERVLGLGRTAAVLIEGVLTNCGTVLPDPGFLPGLRDACTRYGTLLIMDETHTQFDLYGGAVSRYGVQPDMVTGGKGIGGGIPIGAYGMTSELANHVQANLEDETGVGIGVGLGGTLFANALSLRCAEVVLTELMTPAEHDRIAGLGGRLADGIEAAVRERGLDWRAHRFGARSGFCLLPELPRTSVEAHLSLDPIFTDTRRVYFANRGVLGRDLELGATRRLRPRDLRCRRLPRSSRRLLGRDVSTLSAQRRCREP